MFRYLVTDMARIRTVKPEFFKHLELFELEEETGLPLRVAFAALWTVADREGRFKWIPRQLKIECLPYDNIDFSRVLHALTTREFIKKYTWRILRSKMTWYEKFDIILFTYSLPLSAFFALYIAINVVLLPLFNYQLIYPLWLLIPTVVFLFAPMLNDIIYYGGKVNPFRLTWYLFHTILLYGSMLYTSLRSSLKSTFGKSVFLVTPKDHNHLTRREAVSANKGEIFFGGAVLGVAYLFNQSILPTVIIAIPALFSVYLALMANKK